MKALDRRVLVAFGVAALLFAYSVYRVWTAELTVDLAGHLASAIRFNEGLHDRHEDAHYLGAIHGLFYPPMEDVVLGTMLRVGAALHISVDTSFRTYLTVDVGLYLAAIAHLARSFKSVRTTALFMAIFVLGFLQETLAGLHLSDLVHIGLASQFWGGTAFVLLIKELALGKRRPWVVTITITVCILAHLIMGIAAVVVGLTLLLEKDRRTWFVALAFAAGLSAIFWIPFIVHRSWLIGSPLTLLGWPIPAPLILSALLAKYGPQSARRWSSLCAAAFAISGAGWLMGHLEFQNIPQFHFFRLEAVGLLLLGLAVCIAFDAWLEKPKRLGLLAGRAGYALVVILAVELGAKGLARSSPRMGDLEGYVAESYQKGPYGRHFVLERESGFDVAMESFIATRDPRARMIKGLFLESAPSNAMLASYLNAVQDWTGALEYRPLASGGCEERRCVFDHFVSDFNIRFFSYEVQEHTPKSLGRFCASEIWAAGGTDRYRLDKREGWGFSYGPRSFISAEVVPISTEASNGPVDVARWQDAALLTSIKRREYDQYYSLVAAGCHDDGKYVSPQLMSKPDLAKLASLTSARDDSVLPTDVQLTKLDVGKFRLEAPAGAKHLYRVKLNALPGFSAHDESGAAVPWFRGYPHIFVLASGPTLLTFEKTVPMAVGRVVSLASILLGCALLVAKWAKRRRS